MSTAATTGTPPPPPPQQASSASSSHSSSPSNSISLIQVDELSSFGATKQSRLPALIKLSPLGDSSQQQHQQQQQQQHQQVNSMPDFSASQVEKMAVVAQTTPQAESLPAHLAVAAANGESGADKENVRATDQQTQAKSQLQPADGGGDQLELSDDFQVVDMVDEDEEATVAAPGPSLPAPRTSESASKQAAGQQQQQQQEQQPPTYSATSMLQNLDAKSLSAQLQSTNLSGAYASHLGDSLIEMIINLRNENQNLIRALETNNEYVKERLQEFKKCQEEAKKREAQYAMEKAEFEHQARKLQRQNGVLSERLKSLEAKLSDMNVEIGESLNAARSSQASSLRGGEQVGDQLYPQLATDGAESFSNSALHEQQTLQMDATSGELYNQGDRHEETANSAITHHKAMETDQPPRASTSAAIRVGEMSKEELSKRFDANKSEFYALDDPMKQCDQLEQQLNDIGRRDYEICLLQQQLNIYRQDFRLERMAKLEARIQIEKLKNDIDRLCLKRVQEQQREQDRQANVHFGPTTTIPSAATGSECTLIGKLGHHLGKKAARSAAKAAKYAAKQAHLEEKAAAALARAAAAKAAASSHFSPTTTTQSAPDLGAGGQQESHSDPTHSSHGHGHHSHGHGHHHRGHHRHSSHHAPQDGPALAGGGHGRPHRSSGAGRSGIRSEVMNDLLSTANKAMLTGYKMASTHVNLALDKLSQFEQQQAAQLDPNNKPPIQKDTQTPSTTATTTSTNSAAPSAPPMQPPSID